MPGRRDWGALSSKALTDRRFRTLAEELRKDPELLAALALVTARGIMPHLGLWAMRETDDGILPDDGVEAVQYATGLPTGTAEKLSRLLQEPGIFLLRPKDEGLYVAGFEELYEPLMRGRAKARARVAKARGKGPLDPQQGAAPTLPGMDPDGFPEGGDEGEGDNGTGVASDGNANRSRNTVTRTVPVTSAPVTRTSPDVTGICYANDSRSRIESDVESNQDQDPPLPPTGNPVADSRNSEETAAGGYGGGVLPSAEGNGATTAPGRGGSPGPVKPPPPSLDPRAPLPAAVRAVIAGGGAAGAPPWSPGGTAPPGTLPPGVEPSDFFVAEVQRFLEAKKKPWALTAVPPAMLPSFLAQIEMLRRGGATPAEVADALCRGNPASLPSAVFAPLRKSLERRPRR